MAANDLARVARTMGERMRVMFTVDTLDYLHRGGRMKGSQALVGAVPGIKPVLWLNEGRIELWSKARGKWNNFIATRSARWWPRMWVLGALQWPFARSARHAKAG